MKKRSTITRRAAAPAPTLREAELPMRLGWACLVFFVLSAVYFLPAFLPGRGLFGTDYLAASYIFYDFVSRRLAEGALPGWVPYVFGGLPLYSNPGSTFHPVHLLADFLLPTNRILPAVFLVQFWLAGVGMYLLARELRCRPWIAFVAGLAFQFTGVTLSWVYAGHDGRIMVATMAPLFFYFLHRGARTGALAPFAGASATLALALLSFQIQNAYYLLLAGAIWGVFLLLRFRTVHSPARLGTIAGAALLSVALAFVIAGVNFLPFLQYVPDSPRGDTEGRGYEFSVSFSMPPADILSAAVPEQSGASIYAIDPATGGAVRPLFPEYRGPNPMKLHTEYLGALVILMLALGAFHARRDRYWIFFAGLGLLTLTMALGGHTPLYRIYYEILPGIKRFRAPDLSYYVTAFSLVVMAALTLERLAKMREESVRRAAPRRGDAAAPTDRLEWVIGTLVGVSVLGALFTAGAGDALAGPTRAGGWWRFAFFAGITGAVVWAWMRHRLTPLAAALALALVTTADLWIVGQRFFQTAPPAEEIFAPDDVATFLRQQPQPFRVWNFPGAPHRGRDDSYLMHFGIEQAGGEHGNSLHRWNEYVGAGAETYRDWSNFTGNLEFLHAANIRYLLVAAEIEEPWLREVHRGSAIIYENLEALPRAYLVPRAVAVQPGEALALMHAEAWDARETAFVTGPGLPPLPETPLEGSAEVVTHSPDRVVVRTRANRPALLVLADNHSHGWEARVDGVPTEILTANHTFRGVVVPEGERTVEFTFHPARLHTGFRLYLGGWAVLLAFGIAAVVARRRTRRARPVEAP
jgi:hypothetical protein